jgi:hypothetical protein
MAVYENPTPQNKEKVLTNLLEILQHTDCNRLRSQE